MPATNRPFRARVAVVVVMGLVLAGCGGPNDDLRSAAESRAQPVVAAAPAAFAETIAMGDTATPEGREALRVALTATGIQLIERASAPFDEARSQARAEDNEDDEFFDDARDEVIFLILDAQDDAFGQVDALDGS